MQAPTTTANAANAAHATVTGAIAASVVSAPIAKKALRKSNWVLTTKLLR
jgi:hypothetical protein